jgi:hypothetical protein
VEGVKAVATKMTADESAGAVVDAVKRWICLLGFPWVGDAAGVTGVRTGAISNPRVETEVETRARREAEAGAAVPAVAKGGAEAVLTTKRAQAVAKVHEKCADGQGALPAYRAMDTGRGGGQRLDLD